MQTIRKQMRRLRITCIEHSPRHRRGSTVLQTAIVLPALLYMVFGAVEFGQFFYIRHCFVAAARDAARAASLATAVKADPANRATATLAQANVMFNSSWMTIVDITNANSTVTDCSTVPVGDKMQVTIQCAYSQIPNAFRPLYSMTGYGIGAGKTCRGQCEVIKE
jgi:Flp pilus assembly protein TadG